MAYKAQNGLYTSSARYAAVTAWATGTAKAVGDIVRQNATPSVGSERTFVCIVAGTTHATTEPTWTTTRGAKTTDNTVTWQECTGIAAVNGDDTHTPTWTDGAKNAGIDLGHIIKNDAATHLFICTTAGTGGNGAEPTWNTTAGATTADNSITWTCLGTVSAFANWASPHARFHNSLQSGWGSNNGGVEPNLFYVGNDHAETQASSISWTSRGSLSLPLDIMCVDVAGSVPPVSADLDDTATITTTGANSIVINGHVRCYGLQFSAGTSSNISIQTSETQTDKRFENCRFTLGSGTGSGAQMQWAQARHEFKNCIFKFANTGQGMRNGGSCNFDGCSIDGTGSIPSQFIQESANGAIWNFTGCDLSALSSSTIGANNGGANTNIFNFYDCKFPASYTPWLFQGSNTGTCEYVTFWRCTNGVNPIQFYYTERAGAVQNYTTAYRTGGAEENSTAYSWRIDTTAQCNMWSTFLPAPAIANNNQLTATDVDVTVYGVVNGSALPTSAEIAMEVHYLGSASDSLGTIKSNRVADILATGSNHTADTSDWDDGPPARANTTAYTAGTSIIKLASNPGRIFFCTTSGTSAGAEPGGYATAVDGDSVTDGSAVFRAGVRFSMTITLTSPQPQQAGLINVRLLFGKASTIYLIDPLLELA